MKKTLYGLTLALLTLTAATALTGCYRMPTDDDYSVVPTTNNPAVTRQKPGSGLPSLGY